ncbi:hypothetical protein [Clostridium sp.]|uniref:hypothetical protein n=1 Tax=Clostridium sp. TaxID=1506 RepID=UPI00290F34BC|nr:hypothetical protein [Clostridium sp.]MDU5106396.1 hypothetical protein [Clostridium sp.]
MKNNNKLITTLIIAGIIILIFIIINSKGRKGTIEEALNINEASNLKIIHEEITDKGSIVFCISTNNSKEYLSTAFVNKNLFGYRELYSGTSSIDGIYKRDLTAQYFPAIKESPLPIYFGVILNDEIKEVNVKDSNSSEVKEAKIIEAGDKRIWLMYMDGFKGNEFEVLGYSGDGDYIYSFEDTFPWRVEEKPLKSPYK